MARRRCLRGLDYRLSLGVTHDESNPVSAADTPGADAQRGSARPPRIKYQPGCEGAPCAGKPPEPDCAWQARHYSRHIAALGAILRFHARVLDESSDSL